MAKSPFAGNPVSTSNAGRWNECKRDGYQTPTKSRRISELENNKK